jgi:hypothetical protein
MQGRESRRERVPRLKIRIFPSLLLDEASASTVTGMGHGDQEGQAGRDLLQFDGFGGDTARGQFGGTAPKPLLARMRSRTRPKPNSARKTSAKKTPEQLKRTNQRRSIKKWTCFSWMEFGMSRRFSLKRPKRANIICFLLPGSARGALFLAGTMPLKARPGSS